MGGTVGYAGTQTGESIARWVQSLARPIHAGRKKNEKYEKMRRIQSHTYLYILCGTLSSFLVPSQKNIICYYDTSIFPHTLSHWFTSFNYDIYPLLFTFSIQRRCTAIHLAARNDHLETALLLANHGARMDLRDERGNLAEQGSLRVEINDTLRRAHNWRRRKHFVMFLTGGFLIRTLPYLYPKPIST